MTPSTSLPRPSDDVLATELTDGESVLLDLKTEAYFGLNELGTAVWSALVDRTDLEALVTSTCEATGAPANTIRSDIDSLLEELSSQGLVVTD